MFQTNQPSSDRSLHALLGIGLLHLHPTAHVRTLLPWSQRCRVPVAEGHNLKHMCQTPLGWTTGLNPKIASSRRRTCKTGGEQKNKKTSKVNPKAKPTQIPDYESTQFVRHICPNYRPRFWFEDPTDPIEKPQRSTPTVPT